MALDSQSVHLRLNKVARRFRWSRGIRWIISGLAGSLFFLIFFLLCDAEFHFGTHGRWVAFLLTVAPLVAGGVLALPAWFLKVSDAGIARRIERSCDGARNVLINAVQFDHVPQSSLRDALFREMHDPFPKVRWSDVFDLGLIKKLALALVAIVLVLGCWAVFEPAYFTNSAARIFLPSGNIAPLTRTRILDLKPGDADVPHGRDVVLTAKFGGEIPRTAWVCFREGVAPWQKALMDSETGQPDFSFAWKSLAEPLEYYIEAGDARSASCKIHVRPRTVLRSRSADITPPAYTRLSAGTVKNFSELRNVVPGSRVALMLDFNNPVNELKVSGDKNAEFSVSRIDLIRWRIEGIVSASQAVKLEYSDAGGIADSDLIQIAVKPDDPPKIHVTAPAEGRETAATRDGFLNVQCMVTDDFSLGKVALYKSTSDKTDAQIVHEWKDVAGKSSFLAEIRVSLRELGSADEDKLTFCVIAKDENDVSGPGVTASRPIVVALKSLEKLQQQAAEAQVGLRQSIEELIKLQQRNLDETRVVISAPAAGPAEYAGLLDRQSQIGDMAKRIADSADAISPELRSDVRALGDKEIPDAVSALRNAGNSAGSVRQKSLAIAADFEAAILARLKGAPAAADKNAQKEQIQDLIAPVFGDTAPVDSGSNITVPEITTVKVPKIKESANVEVLNGSWTPGVASQAANELKSAGFNVLKFGNSPERNYTKNTIYDLSYGAKKTQLEALKTAFSAEESFSWPTWLEDKISAYETKTTSTTIGTTSIDTNVATSTATSTGITSAVIQKATSTPDFILILGDKNNTTTVNE